MKDQMQSDHPTSEVSLVVRGENLDPDRITQVFGVCPTKAYRKGDLVIPELPLRHQSGMWTLDSDLPHAAPLPDHLARLISQIGAGPEAFRQVVGENEVELSCMITPHGPSVSSTLPSDAACWLGDRGIPFTIFFYNFTAAEAKADLEDFFGALGTGDANSGREDDAG